MRGSEGDTAGTPTEPEERRARRHVGKRERSVAGWCREELGGGRLPTQACHPRPPRGSVERGTAAAAQCNKRFWGDARPKRRLSRGDAREVRCRGGQRVEGARARGDQDCDEASGQRLPAAGTPRERVPRRVDPADSSSRDRPPISLLLLSTIHVDDGTAQPTRTATAVVGTSRPTVVSLLIPPGPGGGRGAAAAPRATGRFVEGQLAVASRTGATGALHYSWICGPAGRMTPPGRGDRWPRRRAGERWRRLRRPCCGGSGSGRGLPPPSIRRRAPFQQRRPLIQLRALFICFFGDPGPAAL